MALRDEDCWGQGGETQLLLLASAGESTLGWTDVWLLGPAQKAQQGPRTGSWSSPIHALPRPYVDEVLVGAAHDVVVRHGDGVDAAPRRLQHVDALQVPDVPDLQEPAGRA